MSSINSIKNNLSTVRNNIAAACAHANRDIQEVRLIAVTKKRSLEAMQSLLDEQQYSLGESRIQEAREKVELLPDTVDWHLIGHLQTNKANLAAKLFATIHSVDSERLLIALHQAARNCKKRLDVFLQVNVSGEQSKFGLQPDQVEQLLQKSLAMESVQVRGLMTMAPYSEDVKLLREVFSGLRNLRDELQAKGFSELRDLSMGMSSDYEIAIEEGATHIRVGSALFV